MLILGLDIATVTGIGFVDAARPPATWRAIALEAEGESIWEKVDDFDGGLRDLLSERRPDFAVIERPLGVVVDYGGGPGQQEDGGGKRMINATTTILLAGLAGAAIGVLNGLGIPFGMISDKTWRRAYYGPGFQPPTRIVKQRGKDKIERDWKAAAVQRAELQGILLPSSKKAAHDAAEAIGIAVAWQSVNMIPRRHQRAFMDLRSSRRAA